MTESSLERAERWYGRLLALYPASFRARFGDEMREAFRDQWRDHERGAPPRVASLRFWIALVADAVRHGLAERRADDANVEPHTRITMRTLWQDVRFAVRTHLANRAATVVAVVVLAIAIGANTAIFSVVEGVLLRSLPFRDAERLVGVGPIPRAGRAGATRYGTASRFAFETWRAQRGLFEDVAGYRGGDPVLSGLGDPVRVSAWSVTPNFFPLLGATPLLGRTLGADDALPGAPPAAVISYAMWASRFGGDASAIGRTITLDTVTYTVVGVMPRAFHFPDKADVWRSLAPSSAADVAQRQPWGGYWTVARLRRGVTPARAMARLDVVTGAIARDESSWKDVSGVVIPLHDQLVGDARRPLLLVLGAVAFVLAVACANVANIQLARAVARRREVAVRLAMGAGRLRLVRQLLTESVLLALVGGVAGVVLAYVGVAALVALGGAQLPRVAEIGVNARVLAATLAATLLTGIAFGLAPAVQAVRRASRTSYAALKQTTDVVEVGGARHHAGDVLVVAQVALTMVLLAGAALLGYNFARLLHTDPGFSPDQVLVAQLELRGTRHAKSDTANAAFASALLERVRALPGVTAAAVSTGTPLAAGAFGDIEAVGGAPAPHGPEALTIFTAASADYVRALGIPLRRGRLLGDAPSERDAFVVNETLARIYFPGQDPIGKRVKIYGGAVTGTIVGVVGDTKGLALDAPSPAHVYQSFATAPAPYLKLVVRAVGDPAALAGPVRAAIRAVDPALPVNQISTMRALMSDSLARQRFYATLLAVFAASALVMAAAGIYGVVSYGVTRRSAELGVRVALGATAGDVVRLVVARSGRLTALGIALGGGGALWATRALRGMLYDVAPSDPRVLGAVALLLGVVALVASWLPGRRAGRADPTRALRAQ